MSAIRTVAIAGASGNLGPTILKAVVDAGFEATVFARANSTHQFPSGIMIVNVDYNSKDSITQALKGQDALISTIGNASPVLQANLIGAAISAGVKRYIPSEFGSDTTLLENSHLPVYGHKIAHLKDVKDKVNGTQTTYTFLINGPFLDWGLNVGFLANMKERKVDLWDGGDVPFSATPLPKIGDAVVAILRRPAETANKVLRIHGMVLTAQKIVQVAKRVLGPDGWKTSEPSTGDAEAKSWEVLKSDPGNVNGWVLGFLFRAIFAKEAKPEFLQVDNNLLGIEMTTEAEFETMIRSAA
ncbi:hypothetical protein LTR08_002250 [Meristemomyces frigidus]|nr:hypothetical protein LTR08_002250 [Meristemomyces frigidus]